MKRHRLLMLTVIALSACGLAKSDDTKDGTGDSSLWTMNATLSRSDLTIQHGGSDTTTVTVTRGGGFTGVVTISVDSVPGLPATVTNVVTTGTTTTALVTINPGTGSDIVYSLPIGVRVNTSQSELHSDLSLNLNITRKNGFWITVTPTMSAPTGSTSISYGVHFTKTGFTDPVTLSLPLFNGAPTGITAMFNPNPIAGDTNATMIVSVDPSVPEGSYSVGVRANGGGYQGTAPVTLTVTAPATLSLSAASSPLTVPKGSSLTDQITLTRTNFVGLVTLSTTSNLPAAVTISFGPNPVGGTTTMMFVNVPALAVASGSYQVTVSTSGPGVPLATLPITVNIP